MCYKYYRKNIVILSWPGRTDRGLSWPTSVFHTTIGVCKILSRSVEIWQYKDQKPVLSKTNNTRAGKNVGFLTKKMFLVFLGFVLQMTDTKLRPMSTMKSKD